jgi:hypothetical protein
MISPALVGDGPARIARAVLARLGEAPGEEGDRRAG